jgi:hypothetical protein
MELSEIDQLTNGTITKSITFAPFGEPIAVSEVSDRLSASLYEQLSEGKSENTEAAINRAVIYVGAVLRRLSVAFDLDSKVIREIVLLHTIYELHIALGHEEAGKEYRLKAKDIILAAFGEFPDTETQAPPSSYAAISKPKRKPHGLF